MRFRPLAAIAMALAMSAAGAGTASAWGWCDCDRRDAYTRYYEPPPYYVYDYSRPPRWTPNGFSYPPVYGFYPVPAPYPIYRGPIEPDYRARYDEPSWRHRRGLKDW